MATLVYICFSICLVLGIKYAEAATCSVTAASFETDFCTMKQEIEAVKQFDSRISNTEHELLTLKHTVQSETAELKENHNILQNLQKNISDAMSGGHGDMSNKIDKLLALFKDVQDRLDHLEVKCQVCSNSSGVVHPCQESPCKNGGKCLELSHDFQCVCKSGFTGERCEFTDYCASSPCKNGGNCTSNILGHVCSCVAGFTGPYCEVTLNACDTNPCKHGACILQGASHKCVCESGYSGPTCDQPNSSQMTTTQVTYPDPCIASASVCNEPAKCKAVGPQDFICVCPETNKTGNDTCLIPYYYEKYGFCCAKNTCKNDTIVC